MNIKFTFLSHFITTSIDPDPIYCDGRIVVQLIRVTNSVVNVHLFMKYEPISIDGMLLGVLLFQNHIHENLSHILF